MSPVAQVESSTTNISPILNLILSADHRGNPYDNNDLVWIGLDVFQEFTSLTITLIDNGTDMKYRDDDIIVIIIITWARKFPPTKFFQF